MTSQLCKKKKIWKCQVMRGVQGPRIGSGAIMLAFLAVLVAASRKYGLGDDTAAAPSCQPACLQGFLIAQVQGLSC